jgi:hypothetical protein
MLTTIGDKIVEIRPKQIIESSVKVDNHYLVPLTKTSDVNYRPPTKKENKDLTHGRSKSKDNPLDTSPKT